MTEFRVNDNVLGYQKLPAATSYTEGGFIVTWASSGGGTDVMTDVYARIFDQNTNPLTASFRINDKTTGEQGYFGPKITSFSDGHFVAVWWSSGETSDVGQDVYARIYSSNGSPLALSFKVNENTSGNQEWARIAPLQNNGFVITWDSSGGTGDTGEDIYARIFDVNGNPLAQSFKVNDRTSGDQLAPNIALLSNNNFIIMWRSVSSTDVGEDTYARIYSAEGTPLALSFKVNSDDTSGSQRNGGVAPLSNGKFVITWESWYGSRDDGVDIYARIFDANGTPLAQSFKVNDKTSGAQYGPEIASSKNYDFAITWYSSGGTGDIGWDIYARKYDASGNPLGDSFKVNEYVTSDQQNPKISSLSNNGFIITWDDGQDVYGKVLQYTQTVLDLQGGKPGVTADLTTYTSTGTIKNIPNTIINIIGSNYDDVLTANAQSNDIKGMGGNDVIKYNGGSGIFDGGDGTDTISYEFLSVSIMGNRGLKIQLFSPSETAWTLDTTKPTVYHGVKNFEKVIGTSQDDDIEGNEYTQEIKGMGGNDIIRYHGGSGIFDGGDGIDTISYEFLSVSIMGNTGLKIQLFSPSETAWTLDATKPTVYHGVKNFEKVIGTSQNDDIEGNQYTQEIKGMGGNDLIRYHGGCGTFNGGGQSGDTISYEYFDTGGKGIYVNLQSNMLTAYVNGDGDKSPCINQHRVEGFGKIIGSSANDELVGNSDTVEIKGMGGNDILRENGGTITLTGGAGADTYKISQTAGTVIIADYNNGDGDKIDLSLLSNIPSSIQELRALVTETYIGNMYRSVISIATDKTVILDNVHKSAIQGNWFVPTLTNIPVTVTPYIYGLLSSDVYNDAAQVLPYGWSVLKSSNDADVIQQFNDVHVTPHGYFGRTYINDNTVVIAHRGTKESRDFLTDAKMFLGKTLDQFVPAKIFINYVQDYILNQGINVQDYSFTGHSLGAAIAELTSAYYKHKAVTFDSPGTREIIPQASGLTSADISYVDANVITYNAAPNAINTMAPHVGGIYRLYPSITSLYTVSEQPKWLFYVWDYSFFGQHKISGILEQFNTNNGQPNVYGLQSEWPSGSLIGYNGYDHYKAYDVNTYYWDSYGKSITGITKGMDIWAIQHLNSLTLSYLAHGVEIRGDNSGSTIWGTTNFDDVIRTGTGSDTIYFHGGNDQSFDAGGYDTYICPAIKIGKKIIDDTGGSGLIKIGDDSLSGNMLPILSSLCPTIPTSAYFLNTANAGSYYFIEQGGNLLITSECANTVQEIKNSITLMHFNWGNFGINKYIGTDQVVLVGSNGKDYLDCSVYKAIAGKCLASALEGEDILVAEIGQNAVLTGSDVGTKVFKLLSSGYSPQNYRALSFETQSDTQNEIKISGIKEGDVLDLSSIANFSGLTIEQNGTDAYINLGNGNIVHSQISLGNSYIHFNLTDGNVTTSNLDMMKIINSTIGEIFYNDTGTNNTDPSTPAPISTPSTQSNWWSSTEGILTIAGITVGTLALTAVGAYATYKCYSDSKFCFAKAAQTVATTASVVQLAGTNTEHVKDTDFA